MHPGDDGPQLARAELADGCPRPHTLQVQHLRVPHRADAGEVALVEQRRPDVPVRAAQQVGDGDLGVPVGAEQVGAEMSDEAAFVGRADEVDHPELGADRRGRYRPGRIGP